VFAGNQLKHKFTTTMRTHTPTSSCEAQLAAQLHKHFLWRQNEVFWGLWSQFISRSVHTALQVPVADKLCATLVNTDTQTDSRLTASDWLYY